MKFFLPYLLLAAGAAHAQATFSIGPTAGANLTTQHSTMSDDYLDQDDFTYRLDWLAGVQAEMRWGKVAVQTSLLLARKGCEGSSGAAYFASNGRVLFFYTVHHNVRLSYLTLPVNAVFTPFKATNSFQLLAGPYVSILLNARDTHTTNPSGTSTETDNRPIGELVDSQNGTGYRRFDVGLQGGLGYRYHALQLQATYSVGLRTTIPRYTNPDYNPSYDHYNRGFQASLAYLFGGAR